MVLIQDIVGVLLLSNWPIYLGLTIFQLQRILGRFLFYYILLFYYYYYYYCYYYYLLFLFNLCKYLRIYGLKVVNITDCLKLILYIVRVMVTIISISIIFFRIIIITIMIFLFHQSFSLRKRTVWKFVNRSSEEI